MDNGLAPRGFMDEVTGLEKSSSEGMTSCISLLMLFRESLGQILLLPIRHDS